LRRGVSLMQHAVACSGEVEGSWAVVAALAEKSATKEASNGKKFGVWRVA